MTTRQIDDMAVINNPNQWVHWPYLPVKNPRRKEDDLGIVVASQGKTLPTVFLENLYSLPSKSKLADSPKIEYDSIAELVTDGWIVD